MRTTATAPTDCWGSFLSEAPAFVLASAPLRNDFPGYAERLTSLCSARPNTSIRPRHWLVALVILWAELPALDLSLFSRKPRPLGPAAIDHIKDVIALRPLRKMLRIEACPVVARVANNQPGRGGAVGQGVCSSVHLDVHAAAVWLPVPTAIPTAQMPRPVPAEFWVTASGKLGQFLGQAGRDIAGGHRPTFYRRKSFIRWSQRGILALGHRSVLSFGDKSARGVRALRVGAVIARAAQRSKRIAAAVACPLHVECA